MNGFCKNVSVLVNLANVKFAELCVLFLLCAKDKGNKEAALSPPPTQCLSFPSFPSSVTSHFLCSTLCTVAGHHGYSVADIRTASALLSTTSVIPEYVAFNYIRGTTVPCQSADVTYARRVGWGGG